jgi:Bacterial regulatory helix-turn-helix protein, lysR family
LALWEYQLSSVGIHAAEEEFLYSLLEATEADESVFLAIEFIPQRNAEDEMDKFDAMQIFVRVIEKGSFSAVAKERGIGQPAVSKQIAALENELGTELVHRTSHSIALTEPGRDFLRLCSAHSQ